MQFIVLRIIRINLVAMDLRKPLFLELNTF